MTLQELRKKAAFLERLGGKDTLLGLYEAVTKLHVATLKKDSQEIAKRLSNILIGTVIAADTYKIKDLDKPLNDRINELHKLIK